MSHRIIETLRRFSDWAWNKLLTTAVDRSIQRAIPEGMPAPREDER